MSTQDKVIQIVAEVLEVPLDEITTDTDFLDDLGTTSLDIVTLIWRIEEEFALGETPESVLENLRTVGELVDLVRGMRSDGEMSETVEVYDVAIGSDHAGIELKSALAAWARSQDLSVVDVGPADAHAVDYPSFARLVAERVASNDARFGILICGSGVGMSIAANKVDGIRAALVSEPISAGLSRKHNNANIVCLGARMIGPDMAKACVEAFIHGDFDPGDDGRHQRRVSMIGDLEKYES